MIVVGILGGVVEICVSIDPDYLETLHMMYPDHTFLEQVGNENIGWAFDGVSFTPPVEG